MVVDILKISLSICIKAEQEHSENFWQTHLDNETSPAANHHVHIVVTDDLKKAAVRHDFHSGLKHFVLCGFNHCGGIRGSEQDKCSKHQHVDNYGNYHQPNRPFEQ